MKVKNPVHTVDITLDSPEGGEGRLRIMIVSEISSALLMALGVRGRVLVDQGTAETAEDRIVQGWANGTIGVLDGVNIVHPGKGGSRSYRGQKFAEIVVETAQEFIERRQNGCSLRELILRANAEIREELRSFGLDLYDPAALPGAKGAFAKFYPGGEEVEIVTWGDSFASWKLLSGETGISNDQVRAHDAQLLPVAATIMEAVEGNRERMWDLYVPIVLHFRQRRINNINDPKGFGLMNGDPRLENFLQCYTLDLGKLERLALFTDGLATHDELGDLGAIAKRIGNCKSLEEIIVATRKKEEGQAETSHIVHAEVAAVEIWRA